MNTPEVTRARIAALASIVHDLSVSFRDPFGLARVVGEVVALSFPGCPNELIGCAIRYSNAARHAEATRAAWTATNGAVHHLAHGLRELAIYAERSADEVGAEFVRRMEAHYAAPAERARHLQSVPPSDCDPVTGQEYGTGA